MKKATMVVRVPRVAEWARGVLGFEADETQRAVLDCEADQMLLCCTRQWGKTTVAAIKALHTAMFRPGSRVLVVAPGERQGHVFLEAMEPFLPALGMRSRAGRRHRVSLALPNGSDMVAVPARAATIRGFRKISLLIVDEAAQVADDVFAAAAPARIAARGALWLLSTPFGQAGQFYEAWAHGGEDWARFLVKATDCGRIPEEEIRRYERTHGQMAMRQELLCEFLPAGGQLIDRGLVERAITETARPMGEEFGWTKRKAPEVKYFVGVDLGMRRDPTAIAVLKREVRAAGRRDPVSLEWVMETVMTLERVERVPLETPYADVGRVLDGLLRSLPCHLPGGASKVVAIDATGAGDPVVAQLKAARLEATLEPVVLTGGQRENRLPHAVSVPRRFLLENLRRALEVGLFTIRPGLPELEGLTRELTSLGAAGYRGHDDMAFALALAMWAARPQAWVGPVGEDLGIPIVPQFSGPRINLMAGQRPGWFMEPER